MFRPAAAVGPVCPMCKEPGIHGSEQKCIDNFRVEIDKLRRHIANLPKIQRPNISAAGCRRSCRSYGTMTDFVAVPVCEPFDGVFAVTTATTV
jgi:hypothetical protein